MNHIMLDLETLDTGSRSIVLSLGAVRFDPNGDELGDEFYMTFDRVEQALMGRTMSESTMDWWRKQNSEAFEAAFNCPQNPLRQVLDLFDAFVLKPGTIFQFDGMWGNGADFDNVILGSLYDDANIEKPWSFGKNRCYRTIKNLAMPKEIIRPVRAGTHHNALDDAKHQARDLQVITRALNLRF